ncbi:MAG: DUF2384 domain-containing protein [Aquipseudomonas alcaligenes]|uniref:DUF2384 domain-containing protein n=1 Tax=Aquipseudomonas alcaligenes TaxID=43263 RepID=A0A5C7W9R4_AQUAC|nr:MAG: DUF2384 domain-containing protein [Pseudomonas alcaligenes]
MDKLYDRLGLPKGHYRLHVAVLTGLPASLVSDLAQELGQSPVQIAEWVGASSRSAAMSLQASEVFCRLVETLDALLELYDGYLEGAVRWLTAPNMVLANELPVELLVTEAGKRAVQQAIHAIEYGLPV